jgi:hypothetical protein
MIVWVRPENDATALVLSGWAEKLLRLEPGLAVDLRGTKVSRQAVSGALAGGHAVFFFGHGTHGALVGAHGPVLDRQNISLTNGQIVVAIACEACRELGTVAITEGARAFLGFNDRLAWPTLFAQEFEYAVTSALEQLWQGASLGEATDAMRTNFDALENRFKESTHPSAPLIWTFAFWNRCHLELKGDDSVTLVKAQQAIAQGPGPQP